MDIWIQQGTSNLESVSVIINYNASVNSSPKFFKMNTKYDYTLMFYQKETPFEQLVCKTGLNMYFKSAVKTNHGQYWIWR